MHRSFHQVARTSRSLLMLPEELCFQAQAVLLAKPSSALSQADPASRPQPEPEPSSSSSQAPRAAAGSTQRPAHRGGTPQATPSSHSVAALTALNLMPRGAPSRPPGEDQPCSGPALVALTALVVQLLSDDSPRWVPAAGGAALAGQGILHSQCAASAAPAVARMAWCPNLYRGLHISMRIHAGHLACPLQ